MNQNIVNALRKLLRGKNTRKWDELLPFVQLAINSATHEVTGFSPFEMITGEKVIMPIDHMLTQTNIEKPQAQHVANVLENLDEVFQVAREHMKLKIERRKNRYNTHLRKFKYLAGQKVMLKKYVPEKLETRWSGPWTIEKVLGDVTLQITEDATKQNRVVHCDSVKPYKIASLT